MDRALYRKYRSRKFSEVVGQEHITKTLKQALAGGRISHAYLFTGPKGVGKTSVARIFAHEVNKLKYTDDANHLDIIEIDAASNRRIDEIRDLRDRVHIFPISAKYKVYIIDEAHMLTREAFNALLKTLEEPPAHCIFILATTEAHKLPETIISRTQRYTFRPVGLEEMTRHLASIAKQEKISITPAALKLLAEHGDGSFRDSISLLDQLGNMENDITDSTVIGLLGLPTDELIDEIVNAIQSQNPRKIVEIMDKLWELGANPASVARQLARHLRSEFIEGRQQSWSGDLLKALVEVPASPSPKDFLEISLLDCAFGSSAGSVSAGPNPAKKTESSASAAAGQDMVVTDEPKKNEPFIRARPEKQSIKIGHEKFESEIWPKVMESIKTDAGPLYGALRLAAPKLSEDSLTLVFEFPLHQKKVNQAKQLEAVAVAIERAGGPKLLVSTTVDKEYLKQLRKLRRNSESLLPGNGNGVTADAISNIFGQVEMLES